MKRAKDKAVVVAFEKVLLMILGKYHTTYTAIIQHIAVCGPFHVINVL